MSDYDKFRQESTTFQRQIFTSPPETVREQKLISYTADPQILREDYAQRKVQRPEAYQFWYQKGKNNTYASRVLQTNYKLQQQPATGQSIQINNGQSIAQPQYCTQQQVCVSLVVVSKDEIEAPWREECLYLQSIITDLEKNKTTEVKIVKEVDNTRVQELEAQVRALKSQLNDSNELQSGLDQTQSLLDDKDREITKLRMELQEYAQKIQELSNQEVVTEKLTYLSSEVDIWKKKFIQINHEYNECQEKLIMAEAELESLRKQKKETVVVTRTTNVSSSSRAGGQSGTFRQN